MLKPSDFIKLRVGVPVTHADEIRAALGRAGAGKQGPYEYCSSSFRVTGRFIALPGANPAIGEIGAMEEVEEEIIETICHKDLVAAAVKEVRRVHPYEEPPIDIMPRFDIE